MRLLLTTFTYPPQCNGVARVVAAHAAALSARGHTVEIATGFDERRPHGFSQPPSATIHQFHVSGVPHLNFGIRGDVGSYQRFLERWDGDVVICHCWQIWSTDLAVPCFARAAYKKVLVSHGYAAHAWPVTVRFPLGFRTWLGWLPYRLTTLAKMKTFDRLIFLSANHHGPAYYDHKLARRHNFKNVSVIPAGVDLADFNQQLPDFRSEFSLPAGPLILCVSTYAHGKNQMLALEAFLEADIPGANLVFIGDRENDYLRELRARLENVDREKVARIRFLVDVPRNMTLAGFKAADVVLCTSLWESGPLVLLESAASGTPFISTPVGIAPELPGGIVARTASEIALQLARLLRDPSLRQVLGDEGRRACAERYNWGVIGDELDRVIRNL